MSNKIKSVKEILPLIDGEQKGLKSRLIATGPRSLFRGESNKGYKLIPKLYRRIEAKEESELRSLEKKLMDAFDSKSPLFLEQAPAGYLDKLCIAQHHGLPTRLLDWSFNPLVALYFSVRNETNRDVDGSLYIHNGYSMATKRQVTAKEVTLNKYTIIYPNHLTSRLIAQDGCFIFYPNNTYGKDPFSEGTENAGMDGIERLTVDRNSKRKIKKELYQLGIYEGKLFPSLDGLCETITYETNTLLF